MAKLWFFDIVEIGQSPVIALTNARIVIPEADPPLAERVNPPSGRRFRFIGKRKVMRNLHKITDITQGGKMKIVWLLVYIILICGSVEAKFGYSEKGCECKRNKGEVTSPLLFTQNADFQEGQKVGTISLFYTDTFCGDYVVKGTTIRNGITGGGSIAGSIVISGIPAGSTIRKAFLHWMMLNSSNPGGNGIFNGNSIVGDFILADLDPCQSCNNAYVFRKDVTALVTGNNTYTVDFTGVSTCKGEGASLVILYEDTTDLQQVFLIYDGNRAMQTTGGGRIYTWTMGPFIADNPVTSAKISHVLADAQDGYADSMFYNGTEIGVSGNYADGYDGIYWDTPTYNVTAYTADGSTTAQCRYRVLAPDCIGLMVCVLAVSKGSCPAGIEESRSESKKLIVYPNPFVQCAEIIGKKPGDKVQIYDMTGRLVKETSENIIKKLPRGIYFVKVAHTQIKVIKIGR